MILGCSGHDGRRDYTISSRNVCYKTNVDVRSLPGETICSRKMALTIGERLMVSEQSGTWNP